MGGSNSGSWYRWDKKATIESQHRLDIRWLKKHGYLKPGISGSLSWSCNGEQTGSIGFETTTRGIVLNYRHRPHGGDWEPVKQEILFDSTPCNYGGHRKWFLCPHCWKRVAILYGAGKYFLCRHCYNLTYSCQQETPPFRLLSKAQKIRERLGASTCTDDPIINKPKGMHWKTFNRLKQAAYRASNQSWTYMEDRYGVKLAESSGILSLLE